MFNNSYTSREQINSMPYNTPGPSSTPQVQQKSSAPSTPYVKSYFQPAQPASLQPAQTGSSFPLSGTSTGTIYNQAPQLSSASLRPMPSSSVASSTALPERQEVVSMHDVFSGTATGITDSRPPISYPHLDVMNSTPVHGNMASTAAFTPMSVSPMMVRQQARTPASVGSRTGGMPSLDKSYPAAVTVFGFPAESSAAVLSHFRNFGNVRSYQFVGNTNWMNIEYESDVQAQVALSKNGTIIGDTMIGVVPMRKKHELSGNVHESLTSIISPLKSPAQLSQIMATATPAPRMLLNQLSGSGSDWSMDRQQQRPAQQTLPSAYAKPLQPGSSTENAVTGQSSSIIGKVMENIFGW